MVLANINYALSIYAASDSDLTPVQCFLARCYKRKYTSKPVIVYEKKDRKKAIIITSKHSTRIFFPIRVLF